MPDGGSVRPLYGRLRIKVRCGSPCGACGPRDPAGSIIAGCNASHRYSADAAIPDRVSFAAPVRPLPFLSAVPGTRHRKPHPHWSKSWQGTWSNARSPNRPNGAWPGAGPLPARLPQFPGARPTSAKRPPNSCRFKSAQGHVRGEDTYGRGTPNCSVWCAGERVCDYPCVVSRKFTK